MQSPLKHLTAASPLFEYANACCLQYDGLPDRVNASDAALDV